VDFLVGGFCNDEGFLFSVTNESGGVIVTRHDIPGFHSIGSGSIGANYMLYYRELSYKAPARKALCYAMEAKGFGEQAGGVSEGTDVYVATSKGKFIHLDEQATIEKRLYAVVRKLRPRFLTKQPRAMLNDIPELDGFAELTEDDE